MEAYPGDLYSIINVLRSDNWCRRLATVDAMLPAATCRNVVPCDWTYPAMPWNDQCLCHDASSLTCT